MSDILKRILTNTKSEVSTLKKTIKISELEASPFFNRRGKSLKNALLQAQQPGIIAEFKRKSPSAGPIHQNASVQSIVRGYVNAGVAGISVLTDEQFFGGKIEDLRQARQITETPILRKDFIIDEFQLYEAKAYGADVVLLIAEALEKDELEKLAEKAKEIGLEVLCEVHSSNQLDKLNEFVDIVGVNNRNLSSFDVSLDTSIDLLKQLPADVAKISESGFENAEDVKRLHEQGFHGFLIGSYFMSQEEPAETAAEFIGAVER